MSGAVRNRAVKPLASLSASLLGRREGARRVPLSFARVPEDDVLLEEPAALEPAEPESVEIGLPEVQLQLARLARALAVEDEAAAAKAPESAPEPLAIVTPRRVAFTLRLDAQRHARLRVLAADQGCSAQAVLTRMLDETIQDSAGGAASDATVLPLNGVHFHGKQP